MIRNLVALSVVTLATSVPALDLEQVVDVKPYANRVYGVRRAEKTGDKTIRVTLGATATGAMNFPDAWRIVSVADSDYDYAKFVRPVSVSKISSGREFAYPAGRDMHAKGSVPLDRSVIELTLPVPMKAKADYAVVAYGSGNSCVTAALTASAVGEGEGDEWAGRIVGLRRVSYAGDGKLVCEFGAGYSAQGGNNAANWKVVVNGVARPVLALGRRTKLDFYKNEGWPYAGVLVSDVFLDIGAPLADGDKVSVTVKDAVTAGEKSAAMTFASAKSVTRSIQANQVGYRVDGVKAAYLSCWFASMPDSDFVGGAKQSAAADGHSAAYGKLDPRSLRLEGTPEFSLVEAKSGKTVYRGKAVFTHNGRDAEGRSKCGANVWELVFTDFSKPGEYFLVVPGVGRSIAFKIGDVYADAMKVQAQGIYCQRCGIKIDPKLSGGWRRIACHTAGVVPTSEKRYLSSEWGDFVHHMEMIPVRLKASGGHHDAGDYNPRSHLDVAQRLMELLELRPGVFGDSELNVPERDNGIPDVMDEAIWQLRLWLGLQDKDGGVRAGTESQGDPHFFQTVELDDKGDYAWAKESRASYLVAGAFAQASRILKGCGKQKAAAEFLSRARRAYDWAVANPPADLKDPQMLGSYTIASRAYAAASLYHTTGEAKYHEDFKANSPWTRNPKAEVSVWGKYNMEDAARQYLLVPERLRDAKLWNDILQSVRMEYNMFASGSDKSAYKNLRNPYSPIVWGAGAYENFAVNAGFLYALTGDAKCRDWLIRTCDMTLGANPLGVSWITGLGERTVRCPLHNCRYRASGLPVAGLQEQGPNQKGEGYSNIDTMYPRVDAQGANLNTWVDTHFAIAMNEPTVNNMVNTMFIFGLLRGE